nr:restriction endonuclease subunit S [uncultured Achromobacter sp.]
MSFPKVALSTVAEINPRFDYPAGRDLDESVSFVPMANVSETRGAITKEEERSLSNVLKGFTPFVERDVLLAKITPCFENGKIAHARITKRLGFGSTEFHVIRARTATLDDRYVYQYLRTPSVRAEGMRRMTGSAGQKRVPKSFLDALLIPLPSLEEQRRIAAILDKADALRAQRRVAIAKLDELLQSVFIEMFGDPVMNPKGWSISSLSAHGSFKNGLNFGKGESGVTARYVGVGDFKSKAVLEDLGSLAFIELNELPAEDHFLHDGDLLFVRSNGNRELVGRCMAVYPGMEKVTYSGFCIRYRIVDSSLQATYVAHLFRSTAFRRVIVQGGQGANIQNINQQILSGLPIPIPDEKLQSQFATIVEKIEAQKHTMQRAAEKSDAFFASLQQRAFSGTL